MFAGLRHPPKRFADLTEREILAVAISAEEENSRIYMTFAEDLQERYPASAKVFERWPRRSKAIGAGFSTSIRSALAPTFPRSGEKT